MNQTYPAIYANNVSTGIVENSLQETSESSPTVTIPDQRSAFPGSALMLPAVLDEMIRLLGAEGAALIRFDPTRGDDLVDLGRAGWNHWTGNRFRHINGVMQMMSASGQIELGVQTPSEIPPILLSPSCTAGYLAHAPLAVHGCEIGALWVGREHKLAAKEIHLLESTAAALAKALFCLSKEHQKEVEPADIIQALARLLAVWDVPTFQHSIRLVSWARATARQVGCTQGEVQTIGWAAMLHDIGKVGVPKLILHKPGPLTEEEWKVIKLHPKIGAQMLESAPKLGLLREIVLSHHEKLDGTGYPIGLKGAEIPFGARIIAVVDAYGAMTEERIYRSRLTHEQALAEIRRCEGTHFDPQISEAFVAQFG